MDLRIDGQTVAVEETFVALARAKMARAARGPGGWGMRNLFRKACGLEVCAPLPPMARLMCLRGCVALTLTLTLTITLTLTMTFTPRPSW